jgi:hypothetical protein
MAEFPQIAGLISRRMTRNADLDSISRAGRGHELVHGKHALKSPPVSRARYRFVIGITRMTGLTANNIKQHS